MFTSVLLGDVVGDQFNGHPCSAHSCRAVHNDRFWQLFEGSPDL